MAKMGTVYTVENKEPKLNAGSAYEAVFVEDEDGGNERWLLLTQRQFARLCEMECGEWSDELKEGRLYPLKPAKAAGSRYLVKLSADGASKIYSVTGRLVADGEKRAAANPEDLPSRSWLEDMRD